jgi:hypothetical protein
MSEFREFWANEPKFTSLAPYFESIGAEDFLQLTKDEVVQLADTRDRILMNLAFSKIHSFIQNKIEISKATSTSASKKKKKKSKSSNDSGFVEVDSEPSHIPEPATVTTTLSISRDDFFTASELFWSNAITPEITRIEFCNTSLNLFSDDNLERLISFFRFIHTIRDFSAPTIELVVSTNPCQLSAIHDFNVMTKEQMNLSRLCNLVARIEMIFETREQKIAILEFFLIAKNTFTFYTFLHLVSRIKWISTKTNADNIADYIHSLLPSFSSTFNSNNEWQQFLDAATKAHADHN